MRTELLLRVPGEREQVGAHTLDRQVVLDPHAWHHLGYGGNPYGPAGTKKTESVKALGACLGRQVLVFNYDDDGIDFQAMGRIFIGLVRCGAWGCFDEFNRLLEEQMSAISQSVQLIQAAIKTHAKVVSLLGREITVNHNAGIFITMNPATKGYGGRQKLPDNLKQLFRPVAMSVPDNELIAEVMMFAEGFKSAKIMAQRIVALLLLSRQLLSYAATLRVGTPFAENHLDSRRSVAAGPQAQSR